MAGDGDAVRSDDAQHRPAAAVEEPMPSSASSSTSGNDAKVTQAIRFLVSLQAQQNQDSAAQRAFLSGKGLSEQQIEQAFQEARRPEAFGDASEAGKSVLTTGDGKNVRDATAGLDDAAAFDVAARMFDDPLHTDADASHGDGDAGPPALPPRTYPRSPLALYQQQQAQQTVASSIDNPLTRYHVLLRFFRSLCFFLVLGGGLTGVAVGIYRTYMLPRIVSTLDSRSTLLKHHRDLYIMLANRINDVRHNGLAPFAGADTASNGNEAPTRKGVLKKVQFADEVGSAASPALDAKETISDDEEKKESGDVKAPLLDKQERFVPPSDVEANDAHADDAEQQIVQKEELPPIDILEPLRASLLRLKQSLQADTSASAIGMDVLPVPKSALSVSSQASTKSSSTTPSLEDESDADSWLSESESDELEFDPFAPPTPKKGRSGGASARRKHTAKSDAAGGQAAGKPQGSISAVETSATALKSTIASMHAYINSQTFRARAAGGFGGGANAGMSFGTYGGEGTEGKDGAKVNKPGDVAQIRADIRSLKGLLLSRCVGWQ